MASLERVCVKELPFPPVESTGMIDTIGSSKIFFTTDCRTEVKKNHSENFEMNVFPNPTTGLLTIESKSLINSRIEVYNMSGTKVYSTESQSDAIKLDLSKFPADLLYLRIIRNGFVITRKVVLKRSG